MKRIVTLLVGTLAAIGIVSSASAALRVPQIPVSGGLLQGYLNSVGESINVNSQQNAAQTWSATVSNNATFTLQIEISSTAAANNIGLYNAGDPAPALYQLFPGAATAGWFAVASFRTSPTRVVVNTFDQNAASVGVNTYLGADRSNFGFYLQNPLDTFYSQDARNPGGAAQVLAYAGTGLNSGSWWLCFDDTRFFAGISDFDDAVLFCESVNPTPVSKTTWSSIKARFH
jgi:hypothetical protein